MQITITPEMLAEAKAKREREKHLSAMQNPDDPENPVCISCQ